ncbi:MAG TPA: ABC transporter substrate-binding protein [Propionibacteriaceae bacterium]|nr:ABC transporter substrate-binding protein [Propionibacteriaceae bacterium]
MRSARIGRRLLVAVTASATSVLALAACSSSGGGDSGTGKSANGPGGGDLSKTITVKYGNNAVCHLVMWTAVKNGYFKDEGLNVKASPQAGASAALVPLLATGKVDFATITPGGAFFNGPSQGFDVRAIYSEETPIAGYLSVVKVMVRQELWDTGQFKTLDDLKKPGLRFLSVGTRTGGADDSAFHALLNKMGVKESDVKEVVLPDATTTAQDVINLFKSDKIDIGVYNAPATDIMEAQKIAHAWLGYADIMPWYQDCLIGASAGYIKKNPEITQKFVQALMKASQYVSQAKGKMTPELAKIVGDVTGFTAQQISLSATPNTTNNGQMSIESLVETQKLLQSEGLIPKPISDPSTLLEGGPLDAARKAMNITGPAVVPNNATGS